jgi:hypothetical protein
MRDKDSDLIFESYRKDVVLNEAAAAALAPATGLSTLLTYLLGASVTAVTIGAAMKAFEKIPAAKQTLLNKQINEVNRLMSLDTNEIRSQYELINFITNQGNPTLSKIAKLFKQPIQIYTEDQNNVNVTIDTYNAVLTSSIRAHEELLNSYDLLDREIDNIVSKAGRNRNDVDIEKVKRKAKKDKLKAEVKLAELKNEEIKLEIKRQRGGGGPPPQNGKGGKGGRIIGAIGVTGGIFAALGRNGVTLNRVFWFAVLLSPAFGLTVIRLLGASGEAYLDAAGEQVEKMKRKSEEEKNRKNNSPQAAPTPIPGSKSKWLPEKPVLDKTEPKAEPDPTPYVF